MTYTHSISTWWQAYAETIPRRTHGAWCISEIELTAAMIAKPRKLRYDSDFIDPEIPGRYTLLSVMNSRFKEQTMMCSSLAEVGDARRELVVVVRVFRRLDGAWIEVLRNRRTGAYWRREAMK